MGNALHIRTKVLPGHKIEITDPQLQEGDQVDVFLVAAHSTSPQKRRVAELLQTLPEGPRSAATWEEIEKSLQEERDSWDA